MKTLTAILVFSAVTAFGQPIDYRFDQVKRTVTLNTGKQELNVAAGTHAQVSRSSGRAAVDDRDRLALIKGCLGEQGMG